MNRMREKLSHVVSVWIIYQLIKIVLVSASFKLTWNFRWMLNENPTILNVIEAKIEFAASILSVSWNCTRKYSYARFLFHSIHGFWVALCAVWASTWHFVSFNSTVLLNVIRCKKVVFFYIISFIWSIIYTVFSPFPMKTCTLLKPNLICWTQ